jgi:hypothetical protein
MSQESVTAEATSEHYAWSGPTWIFGLFGSIAMLYYECMWSRFALHNLATISFSKWFLTSFLIAAPCGVCLKCLRDLKEAVGNGKVSRDVYLKLSMWIYMILAAAYGMLASEIHRLTNLGVLQ